MHSVLMLIRNIRTLAQLSILPAVFYGLTWLGFSQAVSDSYLIPSQEDVRTLLISGQTNWLAFAGFLVLSVFIGVWLAVGWHRFVLIGERQTLIGPRMNVVYVAAYFWCVITVVVVILLISIPLGLALFLPAFLGAMAGPSAVLIATTLASVLFAIIASAVILRISLILPSAAIGEPMTIGEAWDHSSDRGWSIWQIASVVTLAQFISQLPATYLELSVIMSALTLLLGAIYTFLNLSILTTLYAHWVEERDLTA